jgi:hypothetical protein
MPSAACIFLIIVALLWIRFFCAFLRLLVIRAVP